MIESHRGGRLVALTAAGAALIAAPTRAHAAPNDEAALSVRHQAIYEDYLSTDFAAAEKKLLAALEMCRGGACSPTVLARLQVALGTVAVSQQNAPVARAHFTAALQYDPRVTIDDDIANPDVRAAFEEARATIGGGGGDAASAPSVAPARAASATPSAAATSDASSDPDPHDCPPSFPGCSAAAAPAATAPACTSSAECAAGEACVEGGCAAGGARATTAARDWIAVAFEQDLLALSSAADACGGGTGYTCFDDGGTYYGDAPLPGADDSVGGGFAPATRRILLGYDRALGDHLSAGARLGFAFGGGPQRPGGSGFLPLHVEARAAYWFGRDPFARTGLRPFVLAAAGMAEIDASMPVSVYATADDYRRGSGRALRAWKKTGLGFGALGGGVLFALTRRSGIAVEARAMEMLPHPTTALGLQIGYTIGL